MEELRQIISTAVEEGVKRALENANFVVSENILDELLTAEQVHEEFDIGMNMVRKMFADPKLPVQRYTKPHRVSRGAVKRYMSVESHDYLCEKEAI